MKKKIYSEEEFNKSRWTGGTTEEFAIYPKESCYIDRDFIWRISAESIDAEEALFSRLPDYDRILMVLDGEVVLVHGQERSVSLKAMDKDCFRGDAGTKSFGRITDYNLMYRKGTEGKMELLTAEGAAQKLELKVNKAFSYRSCGFYCISGYGIVSLDGDAQMVKTGQQFIINFDRDETAEIVIMGEGQLIFTEVLYNRAEMTSPEISEETATMSDFRAAFKLCHGRYKWSEALGRNKDVWYDQALSKKLHKIDRTYITFVIWIITALIIVAAGMRGLSDAVMIGALIIWTALHMLIISPLIYMVMLPKPISAHIRKVDQLNEFERSLYEKEQAENQAADKVLKKYKNSGKKDDRG